jgi:hypothetical protein
MSREFSRFLSFFAATGALGLVIVVLGGRFLGSAGGADGAIITRLKKLERDGVVEPLAWAELRGPKVQFERISVVLDSEGKTATVTSTLDFTGELHRAVGVHTRVSSLGLERARYHLVDDEWLPESTDYPRLLKILEALEQRRAALALGEVQPDGGVPFPEVTQRVYSSEAWFIRSEREDVTASEDYRFEGRTPDRPVDEKATRRLSLREDSTGSFSFPDGIM